MDHPISPLAAIAAALTLALVALGLARAPGAGALPPDASRIEGTAELVDANTCDFPIVVTLDYSIGRHDLYDRSGQFRQGFLVVNIVGTDSANGVTLAESEHYVIHSFADGTVKETGLTARATLPGGGLVVRDAGTFARYPDGSVAMVRGPHPILGGDTDEYCAAFG